jgi:hypothetical protein
MHAVLELTDEEATLIDLGNDAGTLVGGERITKRVLAEGDVIEIGPFAVTVRFGGAPGAARTAEPEPPPAPPPVPREALFYAFEDRAPDLFFEIVASAVRAPEDDARDLRARKLRRPEGRPRYVVAVDGDPAALARFSHALDDRARAKYPELVTPAAEIAPDAVYSRLTARHGELAAELEGGAMTVLADVRG